MRAPQTTPLSQLIEDKARTEAGYAIAYALLELAEAQKVVADKIDALGFNGSGKAPGTTEFIGIEIKELPRAISDLGVALTS